MDAISLDEWEILPDHKSCYFMEESNTGHSHHTVGGKDQLLFAAKMVMINMDHFTPTSHPCTCECILDGEIKNSLVIPSEDAYVPEPVVQFKDICVVQSPLLETESKQEGFMPKVIESLVFDGEEEEDMFKGSGTKDVDVGKAVVDVAVDQCAKEEGIKKDRTGLECIGFSVGKLRVNGIGALCSFGVVAATMCIFLLGGRLQQHQKRQQKQKQKVQLQTYADDKRIQEVVHQASRLNQAMSSVMGGASTRASVSFGGFYNGI